MKSLTHLTIAVFASSVLALTVVAGPEPVSSGKEMKEVAPVPPPPCDWTGFYIGLNAGGQFGHSETKDLDDYWNVDRPWGYHESGFVGGGQAGYNYQWRWLVLGPEIDLGYMNLHGHGIEPDTNFPPSGPNTGASSSDFYATFRGRVGVAVDSWLFYATGGGIGVNYETKDYDPGENFYGSAKNFDWGYCVGGGIERKIGCHWSVKVEYLYFDLGKETFTGSSPTYQPGNSFRFDADTAGHIVRAGLNFHF
jgi:outer membrane immunogenic protein